ncbi:CRISPR system Cascade subunit CasB [Actinoalloteichus hoggarensis]|uniref:CRISPR-associated protein Cse2 (CRISPR_cse2) n=1 Tax=Actinoalloteichus hoggarensis TaxID=1470176 RepID=A0A221W7X6_9PSEU|nr:type I-E CRISPR-associated protein Cse2/CasB [Actinoalloteichus hoggarensis]ASO21629.1 CRISPR-associated protein Cse2 (CRISPR_cse2) [Actinoalloteichus hoggarensis]MBB5922222.1 CRISPR system Cascade subunit CasB [Actinoalloteichus hoggarensis]
MRTTTTPAALSQREPLEYERAFVRKIAERCLTDRGARASLRSGLGKAVPQAPRMHAIVARILPDAIMARPESETAYYAVAAMIASLDRDDLRKLCPDIDDDASSTAAETPVTGTDQPSSVSAVPAAGSDGPWDPDTPSTASSRWGRSLGAVFGVAVARRTQDGKRHDKALRENSAEARLTTLTRQTSSGLIRHLPAAVRQLADADMLIDFARLLSDLSRWPRYRPDITRRWLRDFYRELRALDRNAAEKADDSALPSTPTAG